VYICTSAGKEYALEAWRLLDPHGTLFPHAELAGKRLLCVPRHQKKDLLNVLRWEQIYTHMLADPQGRSLMITDESE
jgi:RNA polymerase II C-terminal domain phosphatase-like 1/2